MAARSAGWRERCGLGAAASAPPLDRWETLKGFLVLCLILYAFIFTDWTRGLVAASAGAVMLFNARFASRGMLERVDWDLLILFVGLFMVNGAMQDTGMPQRLVDDLRAAGFDLQHSDVLFVASAILSDIASNVPTVMLLLYLRRWSAGRRGTGPRPGGPYFDWSVSNIR